MSDIAAIAIGLQERLATTGIRAYDVWPDQVQPPAALVDGPTDWQYLSMGCDNAIYVFDLVIVVPMSAGSIAEGQRRLRPYLSHTGEASIFLALEGDKRLGGAAQTLIVREGVQLLGDFVVNDVPLMGAIMTVAVYS